MNEKIKKEINDWSNNNLDGNSCGDTIYYFCMSSSRWKRNIICGDKKWISNARNVAMNGTIAVRQKIMSS